MIFKGRFCSLSYRDVIYPWLKHKILSDIDEKDIYLRTAVVQYVDHLEGEKMFNLRNIEMNMELQSFIKEKLGINEDEPEIALKKVSEKLQEMDNARVQLVSLQKEMQNKIDENYYSKCFAELKELNLDAVQKIDSYPQYYPNSVGVKLSNNLIVWIGGSEDDGFFCQVNKNDNKEKFPQKVNKKFYEVCEEFDNVEEHKEPPYYICVHLDCRELALSYLENFCEKMSEN